MSKIQRFEDTGPGKTSYTAFIVNALKIMLIAIILIE